MAGKGLDLVEQYCRKAFVTYILRCAIMQPGMIALFLHIVPKIYLSTKYLALGKHVCSTSRSTVAKSQIRQNEDLGESFDHDTSRQACLSCENRHASNRFLTTEWKAMWAEVSFVDSRRDCCTPSHGRSVRRTCYNGMLAIILPPFKINQWRRLFIRVPAVNQTLTTLQTHGNRAILHSVLIENFPKGEVQRFSNNTPIMAAQAALYVLSLESLHSFWYNVIEKQLLFLPLYVTKSE